MKQRNKRRKLVEESLSYVVEVTDKEGRVLQCISAPSHSYVEQWNQLMDIQTSTGNKTLKTTDGVDRTIRPYATSFGMVAGIADVSYGIRVGKGTTAVAIDDYALETPYAEGTGLDQFSHQAVEFTAPSVAGSTCSFTVRRVMVNNSGATISGIKEIGDYIKCRESIGTDKSLLGFRDVLPSTLSVPDGGAITVTYTLAVTV